VKIIDRFINFKFLSNLYLKFKENRLHLLDLKIQELKQQIEAEKARLEQDRQSLDQLAEQNTLIKRDYESMLRLFQNENKTIWIKNYDYNLSPWENVYIRQKDSSYAIVTKREEEIYVFDVELKAFLAYLTSLSHSIIVLSVDKSRIVLQLRLL
jgi:hypothetical protein